SRDHGMVGAARSGHGGRRGRVVGADCEPEVAAVVVCKLGRMYVAGRVLETAGRPAAVVRAFVALVVGVVGLAAVGLSEEHRRDSCGRQVTAVAKEVLGPVVLV